MGFMVPAAQADPGDETAPPVRASIQNYWQARSNFARSNYARSNFGALREETASTFGLADAPADVAVQRAIDGANLRCGATGFDAYVDQLLAGLGPEELAFLLDSGALEFPAMEALVFGSSAEPAFTDRGQSKAITKTFRDLQKFWPTPSPDIDLVDLHGDMLRDPLRISRLLVVLYGFTQADADGYAKLVAAAVAEVPAFAGGESAIFTLNAFSFSGKGDPDPFIAGLPAKVVVGDGFLGALSAMGLEDVGARVVLAHEYAHQIQTESNLFDSPLTGPEATRRAELMADAYASYFAVHPRGLSLNAKRVADVQQTFYELGDCSFDDLGHHGTPDQGRRTSAWAADLAEARPKGHILPADTFATLFDAQLPTIVSPDA
ncbi:MAG TPA: hypothetical protein VIT65_04165 [Microlunatus sp.]